MGPRSIGDSWSGGEGAPGFGGDFWQNPWGSAGLGMLFGGVFVPLEKLKKKIRERRKVKEKGEEGEKKGSSYRTPQKSVRGMKSWQRGAIIPQIPKAWMGAEVPCGGRGVAQHPKVWKVRPFLLHPGNKAAKGDKTPMAAVNLSQQ